MGQEAGRESQSLQSGGEPDSSDPVHSALPPESGEAARDAQGAHGPFPWRQATLCALVVVIFRLGLFVAAPHGPFREGIRAEFDELDYCSVAGALLNSGFTRFQAGVADQRRPPVVPLLMAAMMKVFGTGRAFSEAWAVGQTLMASGALLFALWMAWRLGFRPSFVIAAILSCFDLLTFYYSSRLLSECSYLILFTAAFALLPLGKGEKARLGTALAAGALLGAAVLARPIGEFFLPVMFLIVWLKAPGKDGRRLIPAVAALAAFAVVIGPWVGRNAVVHHRAFISEIGEPYLCFYWAAGVEAARDHKPFEEVSSEYQRRFGHDLGTLINDARARQDFCRSHAMPVLFSYPPAYLNFLVHAFHHIFWGRATAQMNDMFGLRHHHGIVRHLRSGSPPLYVALVWLDMLAVVAVYVLCLAGAGAALRMRGARWPVFLILLPVIYHFSLCWGPAATARFRVPMTPWLIVLAASAVGLWRQSHLRLGWPWRLRWRLRSPEP